MATRTNTATSDEIVSVEDVVKSKRGRKPVVDTGLLNSLSALPKGKAIVLRSVGTVPQDKRPTVAQRIKKHFEIAHPGDKCQIAWNPETGVPQVSFRPEN